VRGPRAKAATTTARTADGCEGRERGRRRARGWRRRRTAASGGAIAEGGATTADGGAAIADSGGRGTRERGT
jgi:hypothetical protein